MNKQNSENLTITLKFRGSQIQRGCRQSREIEMPRITKALPLPLPHFLFYQTKKNFFTMLMFLCQKKNRNKIAATTNISSNDDKYGEWKMG